MNNSEPMILNMICQLTMLYGLTRNRVDDSCLLEEFLNLIELGLMTEYHHRVACLNL